MNDEHVEEELLQRYFDGALESQSAAQVERHLETCPSCGARHRALGKLKRAISVAVDERARGVDFEALFSRIEHGVREQPNPSFMERLSVSWRDRLEQRSRQVWVPAAGALAAAAAVLLFLRGLPPKDRPEIGGPDQGELSPGLSARTSAVSSEVEQVDFGSNTGTVFEIALTEGVSTPVVWINDDGEQTKE